MTSSPDKQPGLKERFWGKGVYPHEHARSLLNPLRRLILSPRQLIRRMQLAPGMTVLEIGPGPGYFSIDVAKAIGPDGRLLMFDIQQEMLDYAAARLTDAGLSNFETHQGDAARLPFTDDSVDVAFLVTVLGEVERPADCLAGILRVLRPGGLLSVSEQRGDPDYLKPDRVRQLAADAGFLPGRKLRGLLHYTFNATKPGDQPVR